MPTVPLIPPPDRSSAPDPDPVPSLDSVSRQRLRNLDLTDISSPRNTHYQYAQCIQLEKHNQNKQNKLAIHVHVLICILDKPLNDA